jgi:hypothetical protein
MCSIPVQILRFFPFLALHLITDRPENMVLPS